MHTTSGAVLERPAPPEARPAPALLIPRSQKVALPAAVLNAATLTAVPGTTATRPARDAVPYFFTRTQRFDSAPDWRLFVQGTERTGHIRRGREHLRLASLDREMAKVPFQRKALTLLRDHVHRDIPHWYYQAVLGSDVHVTMRAWLHVRHLHVDQRDPFTGEWGWLEDYGMVSRQKITQDFAEFEAGCLVTDSTTYGDFKYHEVGLDNTAEANTQHALINSTGIARVAGTQTNPTASSYRSVASITADTAETYQEHSLSNALTSGVMLDRSVFTPTAVVAVGDIVQFTWTGQKNAEA